MEGNRLMEERQDNDYLRKIIEMIKAANDEMHQYGVELKWDFRITPWGMAERSFVE
jgi:hypothetical protein